MIIKVISDTHNEHPTSKDLGSGDLLIHCGDVGTKGNYTEAYQFLWWMVTQPFKYKIVVPGNHDRALSSHKEIRALASSLNIHILDNNYLEIEGIKIYGVSKTFLSHLDYRDNTSLEERMQAWSDIPYDLDILVTHAPPLGILDANVHGEGCGCPALRTKVFEVKPKYHLFGHIHEHGGKTLEKQGIIFMNAAVKDEKYKTVRNFLQIKY